VEVIITSTKQFLKTIYEGLYDLEIKNIANNQHVKSTLAKIYFSGVDYLKDKGKIINDPVLSKIGLIHDGTYASELFNEWIVKHKTNYRPNSLTAQEQLLFDYLEKNVGKIITKEKIAQIMWGKNWFEQYSEQAIDKIITRMRQKLKNYKITTIRKRGVRIIDNVKQLN